MNSLQGDEGPRQGPEISPEDLFDMLCACCVSARACVRARVPCQSAESRQNVALHMKPVARFTSRRLALRQVVQTNRGARSSQSKTTCCCRSSSWLRCANAHSSRMPFAMPTLATRESRMASACGYGSAREPAAVGLLRLCLLALSEVLSPRVEETLYRWNAEWR